MKYVLDASVGLKWVLNEVDADAARRQRDDYRSQLHELIAPEIYPIECAHTLTKKERQGIVGDARILWDELLLDSPTYFATLSLISRALDLSRQAHIAVYDCLYVALAEREHCEVLTADERLLRNLPASPIVLLTSLS